MTIIHVPGGVLLMGASLEEVERTCLEWRNRLIDPAYRSQFRSWLTKETPQHEVAIRAFDAFAFPVQNSEYAEFVAATGTRAPESIAPGCCATHPVWGVELDEARAFATWYSLAHDREWRLPCEAEWEWMASGPQNNRYPYGHAFDSSKANTIESGFKHSTCVHRHADSRSWCGAVDLAGNVEEWTSSVYAPYPGGDWVKDDLFDLLGPAYPILRGGSFRLGGDLSRSARRHGPHPAPLFRVVGFRLVSDL